MSRRAAASLVCIELMTQSVARPAALRESTFRLDPRLPDPESRWKGRLLPMSARRPSLTSISPFGSLRGGMQSTDASFDSQLVDLRRRIEELEGYPAGGGHEKELERLRSTLKKSTAEVFGNLTRWQKTLVARHQDRPYTLDYIGYLMEDWVELHGDRAFSDDAAIVSGIATFRRRSVAVIGHQKGRDTKERIRRNFGQPRPDGYRKALRIMKMAERFGMPILTFI